MLVFTLAWDQALEGRMTPLDSLAESRQTLSKLEQEQDQPRTRISAMGLPPTPEYIKKLLEHDVERMILTIGAEGEEAVIDQLEPLSGCRISLLLTTIDQKSQQPESGVERREPQVMHKIAHKLIHHSIV